MKFIHNGVRYKSIPELISYTCEGCAFLNENLNSVTCECTSQTENCDVDKVIFIKTKKQPQNIYQYWEGKEIPPVEANTLVDVIYRSGYKSTELTSSYRWNHAAKNSTTEFTKVDIIAWRLHIED